MPNRIIRAGINDSDRVNSLDWAEEVFYRRLLNAVDDHGLFDGRLSKVRADLYPCKLDRVREADISRWIAACEKAGLIVLYEADGKPYIFVADTRWQTRSEPKYPPPPMEIVAQLRAIASNREQSRTKTETYSESETKTNSCPPGADVCSGLDRFWGALPRKARERSSLKLCRDCWVRLKLEPRTAEVIAALEAWKKSEDWLKHSGQFIPGGHRWLKEEKFAQLPSVAKWSTPAVSVRTDAESEARRREASQQRRHEEDVARVIGELDPDELGEFIEAFKAEFPIAKNLTLRNPALCEFIYARKSKQKAGAA